MTITHETINRIFTEVASNMGSGTSWEWLPNREDWAPGGTLHELNAGLVLYAHVAQSRDSKFNIRPFAPKDTMAIDLQRAEKSLRRSGSFYDPDSKVSVKIVPHPSGNDFAVETTVDGDRRLPVEDPLPLEEAIRLALVQIVAPREHIEYRPTWDAYKPSPPANHLPYLSVSDLVHRYKSDGLGRQAAWEQYIRDTILQRRCRSEALDAKEFFKIYDRY
jgi:hypothetical protein